MNKNTNSPTPLTKIELEILRLIPIKKTVLEISNTLFLNQRTINGHINNLCQKLDLKNLDELIKYAINNNLIDE